MRQKSARIIAVGTHMERFESDRGPRLMVIGFALVSSAPGGLSY